MTSYVTALFKMASKGKVLLTGASGLLGRQIRECLQKNGWEVLGLAYSRAGEGLVKADLLDYKKMKEILTGFKPAIVIHSAAERRPDHVQKDEGKARGLNVTATQELTRLCQEVGSFIIYISTDYVFDGTSPPYRHDDTPNPLNTYGQLKLDGEKAVSCYVDSATIRVPILYGPVENLDESAVTILFKALLSTDPVPMSDYERRYPTHTRDVGIFLEAFSSRVLTDREVCRGAWHFGGSEVLTKYSMALTMAKVFKLSPDHLKPVREPSGGAPRPFNNQFDLSRTKEHFNVSLTPFEDGIKSVLEPFQSSRE